MHATIYIKNKNRGYLFSDFKLGGPARQSVDVISKQHSWTAPVNAAFTTLFLLGNMLTLILNPRVFIMAAKERMYQTMLENIHIDCITAEILKLLSNSVAPLSDSAGVDTTFSTRTLPQAEAAQLPRQLSRERAPRCCCGGSCARCRRGGARWG